jgi:hypothetical protein
MVVRGSYRGHQQGNEPMTSYPTNDELRPFLGDNWTVRRKTAANMARYGNCISPKEFRAAREKALAARGRRRRKTGGAGECAAGEWGCDE